MTKKAVVLLSGGLDSATCLAMARADGYHCTTLAFDYGQRHRAELAASARLSEVLGADSHRVMKLGLGDIGGSALTDQSIAVPELQGDDGSDSTAEAESTTIPVTYVPARNTVFLSLALGLAEVVDAQAIYIGVNAVDYSGYPDCRPEFIRAFQQVAELATRAGVGGHGPQVVTPLIDLSKADIIRQGTALQVDYGQTVSCYQADSSGRACGRCDSCYLRRKGFEQAGIADPTRYINTNS